MRGGAGRLGNVTRLYVHRRKEAMGSSRSGMRGAPDGSLPKETDFSLVTEDRAGVASWLDYGDS